jgi:hypothetical protein
MPLAPLEPGQISKQNTGTAVPQLALGLPRMLPLYDYHYYPASISLVIATVLNGWIGTVVIGSTQEPIRVLCRGLTIQNRTHGHQGYRVLVRIQDSLSSSERRLHDGGLAEASETHEKERTAASRHFGHGLVFSL